MQPRIQKWGDSLAVRIPKQLAKELHLEEHMPVEIKLLDGQLVIHPIHKYRLDDLLAGITPDNLHDEFDMGSPLGKESW